MRPLLALLVLPVLASLIGPAAAKPAPKPTFGDVPIDKFVRGRILEMKGRKVRILYDFDDPEQAKDFYYNRPFQREGHGSLLLATQQQTRKLGRSNGRGFLHSLDGRPGKPFSQWRLESSACPRPCSMPTPTR